MRPHPRPTALIAAALPSLLLILQLPCPSSAAQRCSPAEGDGICPDASTCCPPPTDDSRGGGSACLPFNPHLGSGPGVCCGPSSSGGGGYPPSLTWGCPTGYRCATSVSEDGTAAEYCRRADGRDEGGDDPNNGDAGLFPEPRRKGGVQGGSPCRTGEDAARPPVLPRYALCSGPVLDELSVVHGFPIRRGGERDLAGTAEGVTDIRGVSRRYELAYYSNAGSITAAADDDDPDNGRVRHVIIVVHGSGRNAEDYLCSADSAARLQRRYDDPGAVLVVAPHFLAAEDGPVPNFVPSGGDEDGGEVLPLRWNETRPIPHTWRYGADSVEGNVSSYDAVDALVEHFILEGEGGAGRRYPNLEGVVVAGHSAGGQLAQRWALLSSSPAWGDGGRDGDRNDSDNGRDGPGSSSAAAAASSARRRTSMRRGRRRRRTAGGSGEVGQPVRLWSVAANPRSFCYLDGRRYLNGTLRRPPDDLISACPGYDEWEWGLRPGGPVRARYRDEAIEAAGGTDALVARYVRRSVVYLAGGMDVLPLAGSCEDDLFQGSCRVERSDLFYRALRETFGGGNATVPHRRLVVDGIGHDHTFMFQSPAGLSALFCSGINGC